MRLLRRLTRSPHLTLAVGIVLILLSGDEVVDSLRDGLDVGDLNSHMGVTVMGLVQTLKALPDLFEGLEYVERANG